MQGLSEWLSLGKEWNMSKSMLTRSFIHSCIHSFTQQEPVKHQLCPPPLPEWNHPLHGLNHQHAEATHIYPPNPDFFPKLYTWTANFPLVNLAGCLMSQHVRMELAISPSSPKLFYVLSQWTMPASLLLLVHSLYPIFHQGLLIFFQIMSKSVSSSLAIKQ